MEFKHKVRTCLFLPSAEEAANFYVSIIPNSQIDNIVKPDPNGPALVVEFMLAGLPMMTMSGNSQLESSHMHSISILTKDQSETDQLWDALLENGGEEGRCGWLKDRFGVHWQIVPQQLPQLMSSSNPEQGQRVQAALMTMMKIDIEALQAAAQQ